MSMFHRLRQMPVGDLLHRGLLYTLVGITGWGTFMIGAVHMDTMKRGRGASLCYTPKQVIFIDLLVPAVEVRV